MANEQYPSLELPKPVVGAPEKAGVTPEKGDSGKEQGGTAPVIQAATPQAAPVDIPDMTAVDVPLDGSAKATAAAIAKLPADDIDLIEKEWVEKAKQIAMQTKDDPHQQKEQISDLAGEYQKERFKVDPKAENAIAT